MVAGGALFSFTRNNVTALTTSQVAFEGLRVAGPSSSGGAAAGGFVVLAQSPDVERVYPAENAFARTGVSDYLFKRDSYSSVAGGGGGGGGSDDGVNSTANDGVPDRERFRRG